MSFCPECGKAATAEATSCAGCGYAFDAKPPAGKPGGARFKGTMLMATAPTAAKPAAQATAPTPVAAAPVAATPQAAAPKVAAVSAESPTTAPKSAAKATMIGTGITAAQIAAKVPAAAAAVTQAAAATPIAQPLPIAAKPAPAASAPAIAAPVTAAKPSDDSKRNMAYAQTQHHGAFAAQPAPAPAPVATPAAKIAPAPSTAKVAPPAQEPLALSLDSSLDAHANTDPPDAHANTDPPDALASAARVEAPEPTPQKYLPGDPMGPQPTAAAPRAPMLRYDDSLPSVPRKVDDEKRWVWIAAGVIVIACLGLVIVIASRMAH